MFFKSSHPAALAAWDRFVADNVTLSAQARRLEAELGCSCRAVFATGVSGRRFHGVRFPGDERPFAPELWTVQRKSTGFSCRPRTSGIPRHLREQATRLTALWEKYRPVVAARTDALLPSLGLDFSVTLFGPLEWFRVGDVIYVRANVTPQNGRMTEILSTEYMAAKEEHRRNRDCEGE